METPTASSPTELVILVRDLILGSKVVAAARQAGVAFVQVREAAGLPRQSGTRLIVDLNQAGAIAAAGEWKRQAAGRTVVGFVSHVDADTARAAREAGVDQVMARSRFVEVLPDLVRPAADRGA